MRPNARSIPPPPQAPATPFSASSSEPSRLQMHGDRPVALFSRRTGKGQKRLQDSGLAPQLAAPGPGPSFRILENHSLIIPSAAKTPLDHIHSSKGRHRAPDGGGKTNITTLQLFPLSASSCCISTIMPKICPLLKHYVLLSRKRRH